MNKKDEWYTPEYAVIPILRYLPIRATIWCPFDTVKSSFVRVLSQRGQRVIFSHIDNGQDFFSMVNKDFAYDYIVSNPPFSLKRKILETLFKLDRPFAMLMDMRGIFEGGSFELFEKNEFEFLVFDRRIAYFTDLKTRELKGSPPFSSVYVCHRFLPEKFVFSKIQKVL